VNKYIYQDKLSISLHSYCWHASCASVQIKLQKEKCDEA